ncbi:LysR family transcriptional regulator, partial [Pseudomonas paraeruginosa]
VWPRARSGQERFQRLRDFLRAEVAAMRLPVVELLDRDLAVSCIPARRSGRRRPCPP